VLGPAITTIQSFPTIIEEAMLAKFAAEAKMINNM